MSGTREEFRDYQTPATSPSTNCGWVALQHGLQFPGDLGQTEPAAGAEYCVHLPNGQRIIGNLDDNGQASFKVTGHGQVRVEYEPNIEQEISNLRTEIQAELNAIIAEEQAETARIIALYEEKGWWARRWEDTKALGRGVASFFAGLWDVVVGIGDALLAVGGKVGEYLLDPLNAPETFKKDVAAIKEKYEALREFADEDLEIYFTLMQDEATWGMLEKFASDYLESQHYSEYMEGGASAVAGIILTLFTAGGGTAAAVGSAGARMAKLAAKLSPMFKKLAKLVKRRRAKKTTHDESDKRIISTVILKVKCFVPGKTARASYKKRYPPDGISPQGRDIDQEFDWQLKGQQDGINKMSPDELLEGMDNYKNIKRDPSKAQQVRDDYRKKVLADKTKELKRNPNLSKVERETQASKYADGVVANMDALHNPDLSAGGADLPDAMGDSGVNRSLGSQWSKDKRLDGLREAAEKAKARGDSKMNIKLPRCGK